MRKSQLLLDPRAYRPLIALTMFCALSSPLFGRSGKPLTKCGILDRRGETYLLQNDVSAAGTCFSVQASDITLDLGGHTVSYGSCKENACGWELGSIRRIQRANKKVVVEFDGALPQVQKPWIKLSGTADPSFEGYFRIVDRPSKDLVIFQQGAPDAATSGGNAVVTLRRHAIEAQQCFDPENDGNPCGGEFSGFTVRNGSIVQGKGVGPYSDAIRFGQGRWDRISIENLDITIGAASTKAISLTYGKGGHKISGNVIHNNVQQIINRHQIDGATIRISNEKDPAPSEISGNTIFGSPQGGIASWSARAAIFANRIALDASYTNDFCIYAYGVGQKVYGNICDSSAGSGRGIHVNTQNVELFRNTIKVREKGRNAEYKGCESGGAYGIQLEGSGTTGVLVHDNEVTALADECDGASFRATKISASAQNRIYANTFTAVRVGNSERVAAGFTGTDVDGGLVFENNTFTSDGPFAAIPWGGISGVQWLRNTIRIGSNPGREPWYLFRFSNSAPSTGLKIVDPHFENGASARSKGILVGFKGWGGQLEFSIGTSYSVRVVNAAGAALPHAKLVVTDPKGAEVCSTTTSVDGTAACSLPQTRYYNTSDQPLLSEAAGPFTAVATAADGRSSTKTLAVNGRPENVLTIR